MNLSTYFKNPHLKLPVFIQIFIRFSFCHIVYFLLYKILKFFYTAFFQNIHHHRALIKPSFLVLLQWKIWNTNSYPNEHYFGYWFQFSQIILSINTSNHCATTRNEIQEDSLRAFSNQSIIQTRQTVVFALLDLEMHERIVIQHNYTFVHSSFAKAFYSWLSLSSVFLHHSSQAAGYPNADLLNVPSKQNPPLILNAAQQRIVVGKVTKFIFSNVVCIHRNMKECCIWFAPQVF